MVRDAELRTHCPLVVTMQPYSNRRVSYTHHVWPNLLAPLMREMVNAKVKDCMEDLGKIGDSANELHSDSD